MQIANIVICTAYFRKAERKTIVQEKANLLLKRYKEKHQGEVMPNDAEIYGVFEDRIMKVTITEGVSVIDIYTNEVFFIEQPLINLEAIKEWQREMNEQWAKEDK